jgi:hypothetical protein
MTKSITIPCTELDARIKAIHVAGGDVLSMAVSRGEYTLTVQWNEQPELTLPVQPCQCGICRAAQPQPETLHGKI